MYGTHNNPCNEWICTPQIHRFPFWEVCTDSLASPLAVWAKKNSFGQMNEFDCEMLRNGQRTTVVGGGLLLVKIYHVSDSKLKPTFHTGNFQRRIRFNHLTRMKLKERVWRSPWVSVCVLCQEYKSYNFYIFPLDTEHNAARPTSSSRSPIHPFVLHVIAPTKRVELYLKKIFLFLSFCICIQNFAKLHYCSRCIFRIDTLERKGTVIGLFPFDLNERNWSPDNRELIFHSFIYFLLAHAFTVPPHP